MLWRAHTEGVADSCLLHNIAVLLLSSLDSRNCGWTWRGVSGVFKKSQGLQEWKGRVCPFNYRRILCTKYLTLVVLAWLQNFILSFCLLSLAISHNAFCFIRDKCMFTHITSEEVYIELEMFPKLLRQNALKITCAINIFMTGIYANLCGAGILVWGDEQRICIKAKQNTVNHFHHELRLPWVYC